MGGWGDKSLTQYSTIFKLQGMKTQKISFRVPSCNDVSLIELINLCQITSSSNPSYVNWEHIGVTMSTCSQGLVSFSFKKKKVVNFKHQYFLYEQWHYKSVKHKIKNLWTIVCLWSRWDGTIGNFVVAGKIWAMQIHKRSFSFFSFTLPHIGLSF